MSVDFKDATDLSFFSLQSLKEFTEQSSHYTTARFFTIICIENFVGTVNIDDKEIEDLKKKLIFITPNQTFKISQDTEIETKGFVLLFNKEFYCIDFHDNEISCKGLSFVYNLGVVSINLNQIQLEDFIGIYKSLIFEMTEEREFVGEMLRNLLKNLLIKANRLFKIQVFGKEHDTENPNFIRIFNSLVESYFKEKKQVEDYAKIMGLQSTQLTKKIIKINPEGPSRIIKNRIILEAKRLLIYTDFNVKEIAFELGYKDQYHFSKTFSKEIGCSPKLFRNNHSYRS